LEGVEVVGDVGRGEVGECD